MQALFAKAIALRPARANRCDRLGHSAHPCFPTWGGEVEPVGCADIAHRTAEGISAEQKRAARSRRERLPAGDGSALRQVGAPPDPYAFRHPHSTEHREALLCLSV